MEVDLPLQGRSPCQKLFIFFLADCPPLFFFLNGCPEFFLNGCPEIFFEHLSIFFSDDRPFFFEWLKKFWDVFPKLRRPILSSRWREADVGGDGTEALSKDQGEAFSGGKKDILWFYMDIFATTCCFFSTFLLIL